MEAVPPILDESRLRPTVGESTVEPDFMGYTPASWVQMVAEDGPVFRRHLNGDEQYIICTHDADLQAWKTPDDWIYGPPSSGGEFFLEELGDRHVTQLDGAAHRRIRKLILPGFGIAAVTRDLPEVVNYLVKQIDHWDGARLDMHPVLSRLIVGALSVSQVKHSLSAEDIDLMVSFEEGFIAASALGRDKRARWYQTNGYVKAKQRAFDVFDRVIKERLSGVTQGDSLDLVSEKMRAEGDEPLSIEEMRSVTYLLALAGVGNIANILCAALWALMAHPDWLAKARSELVSFDPLSLKSGMSNLPVLKAVISEVERCYPAGTCYSEDDVTGY